MTQLLQLEINPCGCSQEEIEDLIKREELASLARERFLAGQITFDEFLNFLEIAQINIDDFLIVQDTNAMQMGF